MRIVIDMQGAQASNRQRGIGRYTLSLAQAIARERGGHEVILVLNGQFPDSIDPIRCAFDGLLPKGSILVWSCPCTVNHLNGDHDARRKSAELIREAYLSSLAPDVILVTSLFEGLVDDAVTSVRLFERSPLTAVVLYDLIPLIHRSTYLQNPLVDRWYQDKLKHLQQADLLMSISESSGQEAQDHLEMPRSAVVNISTAADAHFHPEAPSDSESQRVRAVYGLPRAFVMYTGGIDPRKNIEGLIRAFARLPHALRVQHQLAIVCSIQPVDRERLQALASEEGLQGDAMIMAGYVPEEDLVTLYRLCKVFVFPSWHEGFGLPALEAMQCGRAVIASNTSSLPEVIGREDALFDPFDDGAIAAVLERVLTDDDFRVQLERHAPVQARKFSWPVTARRAIDAMEALHAGRQAVPATASAERRPKLAYISPLPPEKSGISDYSAEILPALSQHYTIDVVVAQKDVIDPWINSHCPIRDVAYFKAHAAQYERVVYHFGNSSYHQHMFALLEQNPGVVILHDFFLSGIVAHMDVHGLNPQGWADALYNAHGYRAVSERYHARDTADVVWAYPCNLEVLQRALGIVVHSSYSRHLAQAWYGPAADAGWVVVPHLRVPVEKVDRMGARERLGLGASDFVICSFGLLGPSKLNDRLLAGWLASRLAGDAACRLVFVGQNHAGDYGLELAKRIRKSGCPDRILITGWADPDLYRDWLAAADVAVQLRTRSRGETSGTVLDCMNYSLATIVNAHGSMAGLPGDAVVILPDQFEDAELIQSLEALWQEPARRAALGGRAREIIETHHQPQTCAALYAQAIERFYQPAAPGVPGLLAAIAQARPGLPASEWPVLAGVVARNHPPSPRARRLFVDISELVQRDARSGIQRVVRNILREWLEAPPSGFQLEPVYAVVDQPGYRCASRYVSGFMDVPKDWAKDEWIDAYPGDVFLGLDLQPQIVAVQANALLELKNRGVGVYFVVYDLLPMLMPKVFPPEAQDLYRRWLDTVTRFDGVACISKSVASEMTDWLAAHPPAVPNAFHVGWFHLGAEIQPLSSRNAGGSPADADACPPLLGSGPIFLMVGTIEPRKGHAQTLAAFESLWREGRDVQLVLVGKQGWMVEALVDKMRLHPEQGRRLHWLEAIGDAVLERLYEQASCLIAASEGEGFGLPLIEAAQHRLPILARDLQVFREVAGDHATYFSGTDPEALAGTLRTWLQLNLQGLHPPSDAMGWLTWRQSAEALARCLPLQTC